MKYSERKPIIDQYIVVKTKTPESETIWQGEPANLPVKYLRKSNVDVLLIIEKDGLEARRIPLNVSEKFQIF